MSFADDLRKVKPATVQSKLTGGVQYMCGLITTEDIKRECTIAARNGQHQATVKKDSFYTAYGASFSVNFSKKPLFRLKKSDDQEQIEQIVWNSLGVKAESLGLKLNSVNCKHNTNGNARSSYDIWATFSW